MKNITFINAGAGSGKTYRLTTDLARKLTMEGLDPSQVILTTYTELAAAEFREKARKEILNAKGADTETRIKSATQLDNAFIGTVHAISFRFIRKYWYLLDYGADIQPMSDQNQDFYMSQSISDIVTNEDRKTFREFRDAFDIKDNGKPYHLFWLPELKDIVDQMEYYDIEDVKVSLNNSMEIVKKVFHGMPIADAIRCINIYLLLLRKRCEGLRNNGRFGKKALRFIDHIDKTGEIKSLSNIRTDEMKECLENTVGNKDDDFYSSDEYFNAAEAYLQTFISEDYIPLINKYLTTIFSLAVRWRKALLAYKQENHIISFNDMEKIFLSMLTEEKYKEVQEDIKSNFRLLMVDEFQDSNPIQLKIFNRISELIAENGGHSVWVGDPKQAIYGFRGSDSRFISEILAKFRFSEDGTAVPEEGVDKLGTDQLLYSWRSRPALVKFANQVFLNPFLKSGLKEKQIVLQPHHTRESDTMDNKVALYVWCTEKANNTQRARMLAHKIKTFLKDKHQVHHQECDKPTSEITYRDIAVLCFSNNQCNEVASQLRKIGLPATCEETNLMQCLEVYLLKTLLLFMQYPTDKMLRAELAIMLCDATTEDILKDRIRYVNSHKTDEQPWDHWMDADTEQAYAKKIAELAAFTQRYQNLSVYDTVVAICEELDLSNIVEKWGDATQRRHNLSTVVNMAKTYDDMCLQMGLGSSILGFINYLTITKPENKTDNWANTIKVLTYHRSKGLEWPVVILYELWKDFVKKEDLTKKNFCGVNVCELDEEVDIFNRKHYINLFPWGIGGSGNLPVLMQEAITKPSDGEKSQEKKEDDFEMKLYGQIRKQAREEAIRLLYVGVTRAKDMLVSLTSKDEDKVPVWPKVLELEVDEDHPFGKGHNEFLEKLEESMHAEEEDGNPKYRQTTNVPAINDAPLLQVSPSTIVDFENPFTKNEEAAEAGERIIDMSMFSGEQSDAVKGSCIHNFFAVYKHGDDKENVNLATQTLNNYGFPSVVLEQKEKLIASIKWLYEYLTSAYGPATRIERECPLLYPLPSGQILRGEIDLQWYYEKDGEEKCVLIDYKTFPGKRNELEKHTEKYYPQLSAYHAALTGSGVKVTDTLIYYPVQANVRRLLK